VGGVGFYSPRCGRLYTPRVGTWAYARVDFSRTTKVKSPPRGTMVQLLHQEDSISRRICRVIGVNLLRVRTR
jgi:hypothetical protein